MSISVYNNQQPTANTVYPKNAVPHIVLSANETARVTLLFKHPNDEEWELTDSVFIGSYAPDFYGQIDLDFKGLYDTLIRSQMPGGVQTFHQSYFFYEFRAWIVGLTSNTNITITWKVADCSLNLSVPFATWAQSHFLTNQPSEKHITKNSPEWLTYFDADHSLTVKARIYPVTGSHTDISITSGNTGATTIDVSCARIKSLVSAAAELKGFYDILLMAGNTVKATQRYIVEKASGRERCFLFINSLGGIDTLICRGDNIFQPEATFNTGRIGDRRVALDDTDDICVWQQNVRFPWRQRNWIYELLTHKLGAWIFDNQAKEIVITEMDFNIGDRETLSTCSFKYMLADDEEVLSAISKEDNAILKLSSLQHADSIIIETEEIENDNQGRGLTEQEVEP